LFIQCFWAGLRLGLFPEVTQTYQQVDVQPRTRLDLLERAKRTMRARLMRAQSHIPYGPAALENGIGFVEAPSARARRAKAAEDADDDSDPPADPPPELPPDEPAGVLKYTT